MKLDSKLQARWMSPQRFLTPVMAKSAKAAQAEGARPQVQGDGFRQASVTATRSEASAVAAETAGTAGAWRDAAGLARREPGAGLSMPQLGRRLEQLGQVLGNAQPPALQLLGRALGELKALGLESKADASLLLAHPGRAQAVECDLLQTLAGPLAQSMEKETQKMMAELLAAAQGRTGLSPQGFEPGSFGLPAEAKGPAAQPLTLSGALPRAKMARTGETAAIPKAEAPAAAKASASNPAPVQDAGAPDRQAQAQNLVDEGGLGSKAAGPKPPATKAELDSLAQLVAGANDDVAVKLANNPRAMEVATPAQKAALVKKLMAGSTNGTEEAAIRKILTSTKSKEELDQVVQGSGGWKELKSELDDKDLNAIAQHGETLGKKQEASVQKAITLLEQAKTPEEFKKLYEMLGGDQLKHALPKPSGNTLNPLSLIQSQKSYNEGLGRLEALGKKHGVSDVGFGMAPEKAAALQGAVSNAIHKEDNDAIVKLSENAEAMKAASPAQKARMIAILQDGWTKDRQDMAIARILTSCGSKAEFDKVVDLAGGRKILSDVDFPQARDDINKLAGGFDRVDVADNQAQARKYQGIYTDPARNAQLTQTRQPSDAELREVLGKLPFSAEDLKNPALAHVAQGLDDLRAEMGKVAHDLSADPMAKNKLAMVNRDRELKGQPPLDHTSLVTQAYKTIHDPSFEAEVQRRVADKQKGMGGLTKLDKEDIQEIREEVLTKRMGAVAQQFGLSEQDMKTLVTAKMGRILSEGSGTVKAFSGEMGKSLQARLAEVERSSGPNSPEALSLKEALGKLGPATDAYADRLEAAGTTAASLFKVPPSFAEDFLKVFSVVGDVLGAVVNVIPGVGQAISGAYFGTKAIIAAARGDLLGMFSSVISVLPGVGGAIGGAAGAALKTGARLGQMAMGVTRGAIEGNPLGVLGGLASAAGGLSGVGGAIGAAASTAETALKAGTTVGGLVDGAVRGDIGGMLSGLSQWSGALGPVGQQLGKGLELAGKGSTLAQGLAKGDLGSALSGVLGGLGSALGPAGSSVAGAVKTAAPMLDALGRGDLGAGLEALAKNLPDNAPGRGLLDQAARFASGVASGRLGESLDGVARGLNGLTPANLGQRAGDLLGSAGLTAASGLARDGAALFRGLADGKLGGLAAADPTAKGLAGLLENGKPLAQTLAQGIGQPWMNALATANPASAAYLQALSDLAGGRLESTLETTRNSLNQLTAAAHQAETSTWMDSLDRAAAETAAQQADLAEMLRQAGAPGLATKMEALGSSADAEGFRKMTQRFSGWVEALGQGQPQPVGDAVRQWLPELQAGAGAKSLAGLAAQAQRLLKDTELADARQSVRGEVRTAREALRKVADLEEKAQAMRQFEGNLLQQAERWRGDWKGLGAELLREMQLRP